MATSALEGILGSVKVLRARARAIDGLAKKPRKDKLPTSYAQVLKALPPRMFTA